MMDIPRPSGPHLPSLFLALISGFGVLIGLTAVMVATLLAENQSAPTSEMTVVTWAAVLMILIDLPALIYSAPRVLGRSSPRWQLGGGWRLASITMMLWVLILAMATFLAGQQSSWSVTWLPPLSILAVGIPLWWLVELGRRGLRTTPQRTWGTASASLMGTIPIVILIEMLVFLFLGVGLLILLADRSPDLLEQLQAVVQSMANGVGSPDQLITVLEPYLNRPWVVLAGVLILAAVTPMIEEFFKPLALWFIPGRRLSEAEGFTLGLIAGAIFALLETLGTLPAFSGQGSLWLTLVLTRTGTGLLHITCSGLVGWGLAAAWSRRRYLRLAGLYLLAVGFHGSWNLFAQLMSLGQLLPKESWGVSVGKAAPFIMVALALVMLVGLVAANRYLRAHQDPLPAAPAGFSPPQPEAVPSGSAPVEFLSGEPEPYLQPEPVTSLIDGGSPRNDGGDPRNDGGDPDPDSNL